MSYINIPGGAGSGNGGGSVSWRAPVDSVGDLPLIGNTAGDARATKDTGLVYVWDGANWQSGVGATSDSFAIIQTDNGTSPVAESATDTLTLTSPSGKIEITGDSLSDTVEFDIAAGSLVNADINATADISFSKLQDLPTGEILLGDGSNKAAPIAVTGDVTINTSGVTAISSGVIINADINASAAIDRTKVASGTADHVIINNGSGVLSSEAQLDITRGGTGAASAAAARTNLSAASTTHKSTHVVGGSDPFVAGDLLDATSKVTVRKNSGADVGSRRRLNLIEGSNVTMTVTDDIAGEEVDVTINANVSPIDASYVTISTDPSLTNERTLSSIAPIRVTDNGAGNSVDIAYDGSNLYGYYYEDFQNNLTPTGFTSTVSGTNASQQFITPVGNYDWGVVEIDTGTTATGRAALVSTALTSYQFTATRSYFVGSVISLEALSDGTNTYTVRFGLLDSNTNVESTDAIMFRYIHTENSGNWSCVTRNNNTETSTDSGVAVVVGSGNYTRLEIEVDGVSNVRFYINGTLVATNTTNIPSGAGRETGIGWSIVKSVGTASRHLRSDYLSVDYYPSATRA